MQCAKHNVGYVLISRIFIQMCTYMTTDVRNFNPFHTIMNQVSRHLHIVNVKNSLCLSFQKNALKSCTSFASNFLRTFSTRQISRKK